MQNNNTVIDDTYGMIYTVELATFRVHYNPKLMLSKWLNKLHD